MAPKRKGIRPEGVFVRQGPSTIPASYDAIRQMLIETSGGHYETGASFQQDLTFNFATKYFAQKHVAFGKAQKTSLGLFNEDKLFTNLALLLSDQCEHCIKAAVFQGTRKLIFRDREEFSGSLFKQLEDAYAFIVKHNNLKATFEGLTRIDNLDFPLVAVREGLLNAVVHRDYGCSGPILISIFDDRLEILNQGGLMPKMTIEEVREGVSEPRNKALAAVFYRLKLIEAYGTGYDKIDGAYEGTGKRADISVTHNSFKLTLPNTNYVNAQEPELQRPASSQTIPYTNTVSSLHPPVTREQNREQLIVSFCRQNGSITRQEIETVAGISQTSTFMLIKRLIADGKLKKLGQGKQTRYKLRED